MDEQLALIELYEYKVADLMQGRTPRGGRRSVLELRESLLHTELDSTLVRRLSKVDREFRNLKRHSPGLNKPAHARSVPTSVQVATQTPAAQAASHQANSAQGTGQVLPKLPVQSSATSLATDVPSEELAAWAELQQLVWFRETQEKVNTLALRGRNETGHAVLRVIYAVTETAERALRGVTEPFPVPKSDDPLMSLGDREIALQLARAFSELLLTPAGTQALTEALAHAYAQPFPRHPDEDVLAARIQAAEREPMSQAAREDLIRALQAQYPQAADPRERPAVRQAAERLQGFMESLQSNKPLTVGIPQGSILYSSHTSVGLVVPPEQAQELVIYLGGEGEDAYWHGLHLRWQRAREDWQLMVNNQLVLLRPSLEISDRHLGIQVGDDVLSVYHAGDYVLLRHTLVPHKPLQELARQAQVTACLLDPTENYANLRLARATARFMRDGKLNVDEFTAASGLKYAGVDSIEMQRFARQGASALTARAAQFPPAQLDDTFQSCARSIGVRTVSGRVMLNALQEVHVKTQDSPEGLSLLHLPAAGEGFIAFQMPDGPVNLHFRDRTVTLNRDYKKDIAVLLPGGSSGSTVTLQDMLVLPLGDLSLVLVRQDQWVAVRTIANGE